MHVEREHGNEGLPVGWTSANLDELCDRLRGVSYSRDEASLTPKRDFLPILRANNINDDRLLFDDLVYVPKIRVKSTQHIRKGDVVIAMSSGSKSVVGKTAQAIEDWNGAFGAFCGLLRASSELYPLYLGIFLRTQYYRNTISELSAGTNINNLKAEHFSKIKVPIAPFEEQKRIVVKLEVLLGKVDACQKRLDRIPLLLKRFRQSVLAAACSGRLTADWREENGENGLPTGWFWLPLEGLLPKGGIFDGPFGSNLKTSDYTDSGVRVIRLENIGQLQFIGEKQTFISKAKYETLKKHTVGKGDIIFASFIAEEIRACLLPDLQIKAIAKADCFCIRPNPELVERTYLLLQLVSQHSYNSLVNAVHGATRPRINTTQLRKLEIRVCSLSEQLEIVRRVENLFALADQLEARYSKAKAYVDKLTQSILAKAFRGELVPQDPNDEPAWELLERVKG